MTEKTLIPPPHTEPVTFTRDMLDWLPWIEPMAETEMSKISAGANRLSAGKTIMAGKNFRQAGLLGCGIGIKRS